MTDYNLINDAFDKGINDNNRDEVNSIVSEIISDLDLGRVRVANCIDGEWKVNEQAKKAILLSFRLNQNKYIENVKQYYDIISFLDNKDKEREDGLFDEVPSTL